jgi:hypothetical protein
MKSRKGKATAPRGGYKHPVEEAEWAELRTAQIARHRERRALHRRVGKKLDARIASRTRPDR